MKHIRNQLLAHPFMCKQIESMPSGSSLIWRWAVTLDLI